MGIHMPSDLLLSEDKVSVMVFACENCDTLAEVCSK
jgi:hypothetical protein